MTRPILADMHQINQLDALVRREAITGHTRYILAAFVFALLAGCFGNDAITRGVEASLNEEYRQ